MIKLIRDRIDDNYLFGCIKYKGLYTIYLMPIAYWILNYHDYDPSYDPNNWEFKFRNDILNVSDSSIDEFLLSIKDDMVFETELQNFKGKVSRLELFFLIDFDEKIYISGFPDIEVESYLPDAIWVGKFDEPSNYLPVTLKLFFDR